MPKYIIERDVPGAGKLTREQLIAGARESNAVRDEIGPTEFQWIQSFFTEDKIYCVYIARDEEVLREHARCINLPAVRISRVAAVTDPTTAEQAAG